MPEIEIVHSSDKYYIECITEALYLFEAENGKCMADRYGQRFDDNAKVGIFALDGNKPVGGITYHLASGLVYLHCGYVFEEYRGKGVYRSLLKTLEDVARAKGFSGVWVSTYNFECPALYKKMGYTKGTVLHNCPEGNTSSDNYKEFEEGTP